MKQYFDRINFIEFSPLEENMDSKLAILLIVVAAVAGYFVANNMDVKAAKSDKAQATKSAAAPASRRSRTSACRCTPASSN